MSVENDIAYNEGNTGSHFAVGGIDWIIMPCQVSSLTMEVPKLLTAALQVWSSLICSWISVPSMQVLLLSASCASDCLMLVLFPHSV